MATPQFTIQTNSFVLNAASPGSQKFLSLNTANPPVAVDISSGYTVGTAKLGASGDVNTDYNGHDVSSVGTFTFSSTGLTWSLTAAQASALIALLPTLHNQLVIAISNDSGATQAIMVNASMTVSNFNGLF